MDSTIHIDYDDCAWPHGQCHRNGRHPVTVWGVVVGYYCEEHCIKIATEIEQARTSY